MQEQQLLRTEKQQLISDTRCLVYCNADTATPSGYRNHSQSGGATVTASWRECSTNTDKSKPTAQAIDAEGIQEIISTF